MKSKFQNQQRKDVKIVQKSNLIVLVNKLQNIQEFERGIYQKLPNDSRRTSLSYCVYRKFTEEIWKHEIKGSPSWWKHRFVGHCNRRLARLDGLLGFMAYQPL